MTNNALIDTDILSYYFKGDEMVVKNFEAYLEKKTSIEISIITYYEITSGLLANFKRIDPLGSNFLTPLFQNY